MKKVIYFLCIDGFPMNRFSGAGFDGKGRLGAKAGVACLLQNLITVLELLFVAGLKLETNIFRVLEAIRDGETGISRLHAG